MNTIDVNYWKLQILVVFLLVTIPLGLFSQESSVIYLENAGTRVGVLPEVGGRIVYLSKEGSENLLKASPQYLVEPSHERPEVSPFTEWKPYFGHTVWVGPQSDWWTQQDENIERRDKKAAFPPDPWLVFGDYEVIELTENSILMSGPESKISGLKLSKLVEIHEDGSVYFETEATNIRRTTVSWDLWLNTRIDGFNYAYVKVNEGDDFRVNDRSGDSFDYVRWAKCRDYFYFLPKAPPPEKEKSSNKAFMTPADYRINAFIGDYCLRIILPEVDPAKIHPEQEIVEIYSFTSHEPEEAFIELEFHSPYRTLQPGESMSTWEKWKILPYKGRNKPKAHIRFLKKLLQ